MMGYAIERGVQARPVRAVVYGAEGVGKTTFAAAWPRAVFIDVEDGSGHYDVARMPRPESWPVLLDEVRAAAGMADVGTLVVDTADAAEALCTAHLLAKHKAAGIEQVGGGYGKGWTYLAEEFRKLLEALDACVAAGKNVLVVAHAQIRKFEQPDEMGAYDRWELKLSKKCAPQLKEWCDLLLFANYKADVMKGEDGKYRTTGGKRRVMYAEHTAAYDAKNRLGLPGEMPFDFAAVAEKVPTGAQQVPQPAKGQEAAPEPAAPTAQGADIANARFEEATPPEVEQLRRLMAEYGVNDAQLRDAVGSRQNNPYTDATPIGGYALDFVRDVLIAHWEAIVDTVRERGEVYKDIPF